MRTTFLGTVSALAIALGSTAWAQDATTGTTADPQTDLQMQGTDATGTGMDATGTAGGEIGGATAAPDAGMGMAQEFRSFAELDESEREGVQFPGDWQADQLREAKVVDSQGSELGQVEDILVGTDQTRVEHVMIKMGEDEFFPVRIDELQRAEGDASDELTINRGADEIRQQFQGQAGFEKEDGRWMPRSS